MSLLKNSIWNMAGYAIPTLIAIPAFGIIARKIGVELFGLYTLSMIVIGYASIFDAGLTRAVVREIALLKENKVDSNIVINTSLVAISILGALGGGALFVFKDNIITLLNISSQYYSDVYNSIIILALLIPVFLVTQIFLAELEGREYFGHLNIQKSIGNSLIAGLPVFFVFYQETLFYAVLGIALARIICLVLSYLYVRKRITLGIKYFSLSVLKRMFYYGGWVTVSNIISPLLISMDRFILSNIAGASKISFYTVPNELVNRLSIIPGSLGKAIFPKLSCLNNYDESIKHQKYAYKLMTLICFPLCLFVYLFAEKILTIWMGSQFAGTSSTILQIMIVGFFFNCFSQIPFANIQAFGKAKYTAYIHMLEFIPYMILLFVFTKQFGIVGVAFLWTARVIVDFILLCYMSHRCNILMKKQR